jgi:UDPglucose 6-dehydrogenase
MIGFAGLSHLGLVSAVATASRGFTVVGYDPDAALCDDLARGRLLVFEPGLSGLMDESRERLRFTADPAGLSACEVLIFARDVPTGDDGRSDLAPLRRLIDEVLPYAKPGAVPVVLSQVPPGFTRGLDGGRHGLTWYSQVETLIFGRAVERALHPERYIVGCHDPRVPLPKPYAELLAAFDCPVLPMRYESAELAKIAINLFLVSSVSVANTLAEVCEVIGADWSELVPALKLDRRIGPHSYLGAGLGLSGGNLERDLATVRSLAFEHGTDAGVVDAWIANSAHRRNWALRVLHAEVLSRVDAPTVAVWGLSYKPDTHSTKNSPAIALIEALRGFPVRTYDPQVVLDRAAFPNVHPAGDPLEACRGADALVITTPWPVFSSVDPHRIRKALRGRVVIDPFNAINPAGTGLSHRRLGAAASQEERDS